MALNYTLIWFSPNQNEKKTKKRYKYLIYNIYKLQAKMYLNYEYLR